MEPQKICLAQKKRYQRNRGTEKTGHKKLMAGINPTLPVITLNVNRLKLQSKFLVFLELQEKILPLFEKLQRKQCPQGKAKFPVKKRDEEKHSEMVSKIEKEWKNGIKLGMTELCGDQSMKDKEGGILGLLLASQAIAIRGMRLVLVDGLKAVSLGGRGGCLRLPSETC